MGGPWGKREGLGSFQGSPPPAGGFSKVISPSAQGHDSLVALAPSPAKVKGLWTVDYLG